VGLDRLQRGPVSGGLPVTRLGDGQEEFRNREFTAINSYIGMTLNRQIDAGKDGLPTNCQGGLDVLMDGGGGFAQDRPQGLNREGFSRFRGAAQGLRFGPAGFLSATSFLDYLPKALFSKLSSRGVVISSMLQEPLNAEG
jgi:hypothetical protein